MTLSRCGFSWMGKHTSMRRKKLRSIQSALLQ